MAKKSGGTFTNPYSQSNMGSEMPDGNDLFFSYDEVMSQHLSSAGKFGESNNQVPGLLGGPAPGEENPFDLKA